MSADAWYTDGDKLTAEVQRLGSLNAVAREHGLARATLQRWWKRTALEPRTFSPGNEVPKDTRGRWLLEHLRKLGESASVSELADSADVSPRRVRDALNALGHDGYRVGEDAAGVVALDKLPPITRGAHRLLFAGDTVRFGVVSDVHLGSDHERVDELHAAYDMLAELGITTVLNPGDLVCGRGIFPGQDRVIHKHTYEAQVDYATAAYPVRDGITTYIIGGNHDLEGNFGRIGADPVAAVCNRRDDMVHLGAYEATVELEQGTRIYMLHPKGGSSYALSYKPQKLIESMEGGTKPNVLLLGHYHRRGSFEWRNVQALLCGTFEGGGELGVRVGLGEPAVGFHVVEMTVADDGSVVRWRPEWFKLFAGRKVTRPVAA